MHSAAGACHEAMLLQTLPTVVADDFDEGEIKDCDSESEAPAIAMGDADISSDVADDVGPLFMDSAAEGESIRCAKGLPELSPWEECKRAARHASQDGILPPCALRILITCVKLRCQRLAGALQREVICDAQDKCSLAAGLLCRNQQYDAQAA